MPPESVAVTVTTHGFEVQLIDSKFCPAAEENLSMPELTSNSALSVPETVYDGAAVESASVTVRETTFCTFSAIDMDEELVNTGATSSTSVTVTV